MAQLPFPLLPITYLTAIFFLNFVSRVMLGPFLPIIEHDLGLGHAGAGSLFFFIQVGYAAGLFGSGLLSWRFTHRRAIMLSSLGLGIALLGLSRIGSVGELRAWLVVLGTSAGVYLPSGIATITHVVQEGHWGKALAFHELAPNGGFVTAPLIAEALFAAVGWRGVFAILGCVAILLALCSRSLREAGNFAGEPPRGRSIVFLLRTSSVWVMGCLFATGGIGPGLGLYGMLPLFLVSGVGLSWETANTITGLSRVSSLVAIFVSGWLTDRIGYRHTLLLTLASTGLLTIALGLFHGPALTPTLIFFQSGVASLFFPPAFVAVSQLVPPHMRNLAISLTIAMGVVLGGGGVPSLIGYLAEVASFSAGFTLLGIVTLCSMLLLRVSPPARTSVAADGTHSIKA
ncbi:MAG TPA: MFS transporter [Candidatus Baltobacteraceae bacterium]|nr:MFS transporter [Candidatus Baltobacteraceae bacterium]